MCLLSVYSSGSRIVDMLIDNCHHASLLVQSNSIIWRRCSIWWCVQMFCRTPREIWFVYSIFTVALHVYIYICILNLFFLSAGCTLCVQLVLYCSYSRVCLTVHLWPHPQANLYVLYMSDCIIYCRDHPSLAPGLCGHGVERRLLGLVHNRKRAALTSNHKELTDTL